MFAVGVIAGAVLALGSGSSPKSKPSKSEK
jgi:hypothetical protein